MCRVAAGSDSGSFEDDFTFIFSSEPKTKDYYLLRYILLWSFGSELKMKVKSFSKLLLSLPAACCYPAENQGLLSIKANSVVEMQIQKESLS